jgi:predicted DNA-binding protein (MmcQ/YjbR family)
MCALGSAGRNASPGFGPACHAENVVRRDWMSYCLAKPGAWRDEPWEGDLVVKVGGKIFAFLGENGASPAIGLKCGDRETADLLIERYPSAVTRSPYIGQHGWNSITLDGTIPDDEVADLVDTSYALVVAKLPKKDRPPE